MLVRSRLALKYVDFKCTVLKSAVAEIHVLKGAFDVLTKVAEDLVPDSYRDNMILLQKDLSLFLKIPGNSAKQADLFVLNGIVES